MIFGLPILIDSAPAGTNIPVSEIQKLAPSAIVDLFVLDLSGGGFIKNNIYYFHSGTNSLNGDIVWQGITYTRYPIEATGFERSGKGTLPRPTIKAANITGALSELARVNEDFIGGKLIRKRTFVKYLDAVNFPGSTNPSADPTAHFPDEIWIIDRKSAENAVYVEFELAASFDVAGVLLPRRQCIQNTCTWKYRGPECGYTGGAVAKIDDTPTSNLSEDVCGKRLSSCKLRFGNNSELPFGAFPAVGLIQ